MVQIDIDERNAGWSFPIEIGLVGDAGSILNQLVAASKEAATASATQRNEWTDSMAARKQTSSFYDDPGMHKDSSPVTPQRLVSVLNETSDPSTVYALDAGNNRTWMAHLYQAQQAGTFYCPGGTAGMGWALPAAVGLKLVYPDQPVTAVTGDGGFMMTVNAPFDGNAVRPTHHLRRLQRQRAGNGPGPPATRTGDRLRILPHRQRSRCPADSDASGVHVEDSRDLPDALREAKDSGLPAVVDVAIDRDPSPDDWRADARRSGET